ncbi:hypothetical protein WME89_00865 [Sorangium sp. So ce321]|uniref:hypothetical protein n=1 Tax=Sorangium sp. So ce321 TaxID=3133300 RepID=UPI003F63FBF5
MLLAHGRFSTVALLDKPTSHHELEQVRGRDRITTGFFLGFLGDGLLNAIVWS